MTIQLVERYQTNDGKVFETQEKAKNYLVSEVQQFLDNKTYPLVGKGMFSRADQVSFIKGLVKDFDDLEELHNFLSNLMD